MPTVEEPISSRTSISIGILVVGVALVIPGPSAAQQETDLAQPATASRWIAFPEPGFYPHYIADPLRSQMTLMLAGVPVSGIPETGDTRVILRLGGRFPLFRRQPEGDPQRGIQLDFEGGFYGHFDVGYNLDNIGWDGLFGLVLSWKPTPGLGFRVGRLHDSAHVGDEYAERTGRTRIGYTREEWVVGACWRVTPAWVVYAEGGFAPDVDDPQQESRLQVGGQWSGRRRFWGGHASWYAAVDLRGYEETDWTPRSAAQVGIMWPLGEGSRRYRFAIEIVDGPSVLGEFFLASETTIGLGWYFDF
jgi:hypothetical protein